MDTQYSMVIPQFDIKRSVKYGHLPGSRSYWSSLCLGAVPAADTTVVSGTKSGYFPMRLNKGALQWDTQTQTR